MKTWTKLAATLAFGLTLGQVGSATAANRCEGIFSGSKAQQSAVEILKDPSCSGGACHLAVTLEKASTGADPQVSQLATQLLVKMKSNGKGRDGITMTLSKEREKKIEEACR